MGPLGESPVKKTQKPASDLVTKTCDSTKDPEMCASMLESDPGSAQATDTKGLSRIAIQVVASNAKDTYTLAYGLLSNETDVMRWYMLAGCQYHYNETTRIVGTDGLKAFDAGNFTGAYHCLESAISAANECNSLKLAGLETFDDKNKRMLAFANVAMTILKSLN